MKGYWIIFGSDVIDPNAQQEYSRLWTSIGEKYSAKVRFLEPGVLVESEFSTRVLAVEFPSYKHATACYIDPAYSRAKQFALRAYKREVIIIEGDLA